MPRASFVAACPGGIASGGGKILPGGEPGMVAETKSAGPGFVRREWGFVFFALVMLAGLLGGAAVMILKLAK